MQSKVFALVSAAFCALGLCAAGVTAHAGERSTVEQAGQMLHYSGGNDRFRVEVTPNYSEELGASLKGAVGGYLTDGMALGLIVEYGENKREYLANAGIQFNDALSLIGTVGMLEEHNAYADGEGDEAIQQMEYGASIKGAYQIGLLGGFELNGYLADAEADAGSVETGKLYGVQLLSDLDLTDTAHMKIGGGYEWLEWDETGDDDSRWTFSAEALQQLADRLSLTGNAKLGASEYVYGGGLALDLGGGGLNTNSLAVNYSYIDGKNGIEDDQRVELSWSYGFGAGPASSVASADLTDKSGMIRAAADAATVVPANTLLGDVMKRPGYLPERVLARAAPDSSAAECRFVADSTVVNLAASSKAGPFYLSQLTPAPPFAPEQKRLITNVEVSSEGSLIVNLPLSGNTDWINSDTVIFYAPTYLVPSATGPLHIKWTAADGSFCVETVWTR